jgi:hypothetical protein
VGYVWLEREPAPMPVGISWLSPVGATLESKFRDDFSLGQRVRVLLAIGDDCPLDGHVIEVRRGEDRCEIRISFALIAARTARWVLAFLQGLIETGEAEGPAVTQLETVQLTQRVEIEPRLRSLFEQSAEAWVQSVGGGPKRTARLEPDGSLLTRWDPTRPGLDKVIRVSACGYNSVYEFEIDHPLGGFRPPDRMTCRRRRWHRRVGAPPRLRVRAHHPLWPQIRIERPAHDVSYGGLSFKTDALDDLLYPGLVLNDVEVAWKGGESIRMPAVVRHVSREPATGAQVCGIELLFDLAEPTAQQWCDAVESLMHPMTSLAGGWDDDVWELYARSGYFSLSDKTPEDFSEQRRAFARSSNLLRRAPRVGFRIDWVGETRVEASISQVQAWPGSWLVYQLARHQESRPMHVAGEQVLRELYLHAYERLQRTTGARWLVSYVQDVARFSRMLHYDHAAQYAETGRAYLRPFWAMERECDEPIPVADSKTEIGLATADEVLRLAQLVVAQRSPDYAVATGLSAVQLGERKISPDWEAGGLTRDRTVFVARRGGFMVAAAVCEKAENGVHLYGLLDCVRTFAFVPEARETFPELLAAAQRWFSSAGKRRFVHFVDEDDHPQQVRDLGFVDLGKAHTLVVSIDLLPELLERVFAVTCRRKERRA